MKVLQLRLLTGSLYFTHTAESVVQTRWQKSIFCRTNAEQMQEESNWISTMTPTVCKANAGWTQRELLSDNSYGVQSLKKWKKKKSWFRACLVIVTFYWLFAKRSLIQPETEKNLPQNKMSETVKIEQIIETYLMSCQQAAHPVLWRNGSPESKAADLQGQNIDIERERQNRQKVKNLITQIPKCAVRQKETRGDMIDNDTTTHYQIPQRSMSTEVRVRGKVCCVWDVIWGERIRRSKQALQSGDNNRWLLLNRFYSISLKYIFTINVLLAGRAFVPCQQTFGVM